jgi:hypothetical protein
METTFGLIASELVLLVGLIRLFVAVHDARGRIGFFALRELRSRAVTPIAEARAGRVKLAGTARAEATRTSQTSQLECIAIHRMNVSESAGTITERHERYAAPFELDDGTGTIAIDPAGAVLDLEVLQPFGNGSWMLEEVLRNGDSVVVVGDLAPDAPRRFATPPLVSWRSIPEAIPKLPVQWPEVVSSSLAAIGAVGSVYCLAVGGAEERDIGLKFGGILGIVLLAAIVTLTRAARGRRVTTEP